ncbi:transcriptional regulator [Halieaceae bacterium IMCC14734]|uniref:Transcriptional regulator n=1 Tax=Candidatus Litorirhabdus singularis TaxID=2518993 RepID=A0ABT3TBL8_9GAMM|nr:hypothetical protein [Candidatus Litorirhabdus singularis]MCX2979686.1 transcriptional regulator [Candidatus Litorirhabdus singularis]
MKQCTRIEIVVEQSVSGQVIDLLHKVGAPGYTLIPDIRGEGDRGTRRGDELAGDSSNCLFIIACDDDTIIESLKAGLRPLLSRSGGVCLLSAAEWLRH